MFDSKLDLYSGSPSGVGTTNATGQQLGRNRTYRAWGRCSGDMTGAGATCSVAITESATQGGTYAAIPGAAALVISEQVSIQGTSVRPEIPAPFSPYAPVNPPTTGPLPSVVFTTTKDWVRAEVTLAGTSPSFPSTSVKIEPLDKPTVASGR